MFDNDKNAKREVLEQNWDEELGARRPKCVGFRSPDEIFPEEFPLMSLCGKTRGKW